MSNIPFNIKDVSIDGKLVIKTHGLGKNAQAQRYIDSKVLEYCEPFVPKDTNALIESGINNTDIGSGYVIYNTPYARRWYYMPANFQESPQRGNYWFERMKQQYLQNIKDGVSRITGAKVQ